MKSLTNDKLEKELLNAELNSQKKRNKLEEFCGILSDEVADKMLKDIYESRVSKD